MSNLNTSQHFLEQRIPPMVIFGCFVLIMWAIAIWFPVFEVAIPFRRTITVFLMATAILTGFKSIMLFFQAQTAIHPGNTSRTTTLITSGPYKHTRNPMYLALSLILIGWGVFLSDLLALMLMPGYYAYMTRFQVIPEERKLIAEFGNEYEEYAEKTPRWL